MSICFFFMITCLSLLKTVHLTIFTVKLHEKSYLLYLLQLFTEYSKGTCCWTVNRFLTVAILQSFTIQIYYILQNCSCIVMKIHLSDNGIYIRLGSWPKLQLTWFALPLNLCSSEIQHHSSELTCVKENISFVGRYDMVGPLLTLLRWPK